MRSVSCCAERQNLWWISGLAEQLACTGPHQVQLSRNVLSFKYQRQHRTVSKLHVWWNFD